MRTTGQRGFSITELMVSVALGVVLIAGVIEVYVGSKQTSRTQNALARLQENARFAIDILSRDIRNSGFVGCSRIQDITVEGEIVAGLNYDQSVATWGLQSEDEGAGNVSGGHDIAAINAIYDDDRYGESDVLVVQGAGGCSAAVSLDMAANTDAITLDANSCDFGGGDFVMVSNCDNADVFQIPAAYGGGPLVHANPLSITYLADGFTEVFPFSSNTYFIAEELQPDDVTRIPALYVADNTEDVIRPVAVVQGVENMQIQYGFDTDADGFANRYFNASQIGAAVNWASIVSVRVTLLMRTVEDLRAQDPGPLTLGGDTEIEVGEVGPIYQEFVSTIQLRNRG